MATVDPIHKRVYWDSNGFWSENWPDLSAAMVQLLGLGKSLNVETVLLSAVEKELEAHWTREEREARAKLNQLGRILRRVGLSAPAAVTTEEILGAYRRAVDEVVQKRSLIRSSLPLPSTEELFEMAIQQKRPFGEKGKNFQDAVICLAAISDLAASGFPSGIFVSNDSSSFDQTTLDRLAASSNVKLVLLKSADELLSYLRNHLEGTRAAAWTERDSWAESAVSKVLPRIQDFVSATLKIQEDEAVYGKIEAVRGLKILALEKVKTPDPKSYSDGDRIRISARLSISIDVQVRTLQVVPDPPQILTVGQKKTLTAKSISVGSMFDGGLVKTVNVELDATFRSERFVDLEPVSVSFVRDHSAFYGEGSYGVGSYGVGSYGVGSYGVGSYGRETP